MAFDMQQIKREWNYWVNPTDLQIDIARDKRRESPRLDELQAKYKKLKLLINDMDQKIIDLKVRGALSPGSKLLPEFNKLLENYYSIVHLRSHTGVEIDEEIERLENRAQLIEGGMQFVKEFFDTAFEVPVETINFVRGIVNILA